MFPSRTPGPGRLNRTHKASIAGVAAAGVAALTFSLVPGASADAHAAQSVSASQVALKTTPQSAPAAAPAGVSKQQISAENTAKIQSAATVKAAAAAKAKAEKQTEAEKKAEAKEKAAKTKAEKEKAAKEKAAAKAKAAKARAEQRAKAEKAAKARAKAAKKRAEAQAASRSAERRPVYANNLNGWISESLSIMKKHDIPGSYHGLYRNIIRESSGNPNAINLWDVNAQNGIPSKGLLQVIPPTFAEFHVNGTSGNIYDPVANIVAAANYAAHKYGSMDNVYSAY